MRQDVKIGVRGYTVSCQIYCYIYKLQHYVDEVCQRYLHYFMFFENFVTFTNCFIILSLFYSFSRSFYIIPYMDSQPWKAILNQEEICCNPIG